MPSLKSFIIEAFSSPVRRPCSSAALYPENLSFISSKSFCTDSMSSSSLSMLGAITYALFPFSSSRLIPLYARSLVLWSSARVIIFLRSLGIDLIMLKSMSPKTVAASVRGIGVALMTQTFTPLPFVIRLFLCATPNLCCSSVITRARSLNETSFCISACVPISTSVFPLATSSITLRLSAAFMPLTSRSHFIPYTERSLLIVS